MASACAGQSAAGGKDNGDRMQEISEDDIAEVMNILENFSRAETSRMKIQVSAEAEAGTVSKAYHHGRCDVGSPWAKGEWFDVLE